MLTSTVQVRFRMSPDTAVPDSEIVTACSRSGGERYQSQQGQHLSQCLFFLHIYTQVIIDLFAYDV